MHGAERADAPRVTQHKITHYVHASDMAAHNGPCIHEAGGGIAYFEEQGIRRH